MGSLVGVLLFCAAPATAYPTPAKPPTDQSYYVYSLTPQDAQSVGCSYGKAQVAADNAEVRFSEVILDFGAQYPSGSFATLSTNNKSQFTTSEIEAVGKGYANCYAARATGISTSTLALGTNNSGRLDSLSDTGARAEGRAWAGIVKDVAAYVLASPLKAAHVNVWGGDDMEVAFGNGALTEDWALAYSEATASNYVDYGAAEACPQFTHTNGACNPTGNKGDWDQHREWSVSSGIHVATAAPEIYYNPGTYSTPCSPPSTGGPANAESWAQIALWGDAYTHLQTGELFQGPLDQHGSAGSNSSSQAWTQLAQQLGCHYETHLAENLMVYSMSIGGQPPVAAANADEARAKRVKRASNWSTVASPATATPATGSALGVPSASELADDYAACMGPYSQDPTDKLAVLRATFCQGLETYLGSTPPAEIAAEQTALANQEATDEANALLAPPAPAGATTSGIFTGSQTPFSNLTFYSTGGWTGTINGTTVAIYAGAEVDPDTGEATQPAVVAYTINPDGTMDYVGTYAAPGTSVPSLAPTADAPLTATSETENTLTLTAGDGSPLTFDLATDQFN